MSRFADRVVVVTGGARGIGAATARRFAAEGASVAVLDLDPEAATASAEALGPGPDTGSGSGRGSGPGAGLGIGCDVADSGSVESAVAEVVDRFGRLDVLVNNAGVTRDNLLFKMTESDWDTVMDVHLRGAFLMSRAAQQHMVAARYGKILNLSSTSALGNRGQANYAAAKMGLQGFTRTLALELGPFGINVNAVAPGFVVTDMTDATARRLGMEPEEYRRASAELTPLRRVGRPEDIAATAAFLCSDEAGYITGQTLYVDGGAKV